MKTEADRLRRELAARSHRRGPLPTDLRDRARAYVVARRAADLTLVKIAAEIGLAMETVGRWTRPRLPTTSTSALVPVHVVDAPTSYTQQPVTTPLVVTPNGLRIQGLTFEQIVVLVERHG